MLGPIDLVVVRKSQKSSYEFLNGMLVIQYRLVAMPFHAVHSPHRSMTLEVEICQGHFPQGQGLF